MNLFRIITSVAFATSLFHAGPCLADSLDSQMHTEVTQKVQTDHEQDLKAGKIKQRSSREPASAQAPSNAAISTAAGGTSGTLAHPTQVQQLQKKASTTPPPPAKTTKPAANSVVH